MEMEMCFVFVCVSYVYDAIVKYMYVGIGT